jgi:4-methylaminobutanoate oxidase (formaldehyde-forming)
LLGASWIPSDGYVDPNQLTHAFASGARAHGVSIIQDCSVTGIEREGRRVRAVRTEHGRTACEVLVNATGMWGRATAQLADVDIAVQALEHQYVVTEQAGDLPRDLPTLRDPDARFYLKPEAGGLLVGGWEARTRAPWDRVPDGFGAELFAPDYDRFASLAEGTVRRVPDFEKLGIRAWVNGPIPFSPDAEPLMGATDEIENLYHCCGFSAGIAAAGGAGWALANWIIDNDPGLDLAPFDVRRFGPSDRVGAQLVERAVAAYGRYYAIRSADQDRNRAAS